MSDHDHDFLAPQQEQEHDDDDDDDDDDVDHQDEHDDDPMEEDPVDAKEDEDDDDRNDPRLAQLLLQLRRLASEHGIAVHEAVHVDRARVLLQLTQHRVREAIQLYWDDFLARREHPNQNNYNNNMDANAAENANNNAEEEEKEEALQQQAQAHNEEEDFQSENEAEEDEAALAAAAAADDNDDDDIEVEEEEEEVDSDEAWMLDHNNNNLPRLAQDPPQERPINHNPRRIISSSINDVSDEDEGVWQWLGGQPRRVRGRSVTAKNEDDEEQQPATKKRHACTTKKAANANTNANANATMEEEDGYISENDWIWSALRENGLEVNALTDPTSLLWGLAVGDVDEDAAAAATTASTTTTTTTTTKQQDVDTSTTTSTTTTSGIPRTWMNAGFHVCIARERNDNDSSNNKITGIGLALHEPHEDDMAYFIHKHVASLSQQPHESSSAQNKIPPPYHCRGLTALLSTVTALLYTGATPSSHGHVSCAATSRPSLVQVVEEFNQQQQQEQELHQHPKDKTNTTNSETTASSSLPRLRRDLDARLADALASLLTVAAKASMDRKRRALESLYFMRHYHSKKNKNRAAAEAQRQWQKLQRKLQLVPTCAWEVDPNGDVRLPEIHKNDENDDTNNSNNSNNSMCQVQFTTSLTHVDDLRSYVVANWKSFTSSGGCALFLETLVRIHGVGAIRRQMNHCNNSHSSNKNYHDNKTLIHCACDKLHYERLAHDPTYAKHIKSVTAKTQEEFDTTPRVGGDTCVTVELLTLLWTGQVQTDFRHVSCPQLGMGLLQHATSDGVLLLSDQLTHPERPVWILQGPTCYSVVWLHGCHPDDYDNGINDRKPSTSSSMDPYSFARSDPHHGQVAKLVHWNCWYGKDSQQPYVHATHFCLTANRSSSSWKPPHAVQHESDNDDERKYHEHTDKRHQKHWLSHPSMIPSQQELDRVVAHPDDVTFYPGQHRLWRYDLSGSAAVLVQQDDDDDGGHKHHNKDISLPPPPQQSWRPYYRLSDREKWIVETKLGPKIAPILWTRFPGATLDRFVPSGAAAAEV